MLQNATWMITSEEWGTTDQYCPILEIYLKDSSGNPVSNWKLQAENPVVSEFCGDPTDYGGKLVQSSNEDGRVEFAFNMWKVPGGASGPLTISGFYLPDIHPSQIQTSVTLQLTDLWNITKYVPTKVEEMDVNQKFVNDHVVLGGNSVYYSLVCQTNTDVEKPPPTNYKITIYNVTTRKILGTDENPHCVDAPIALASRADKNSKSAFYYGGNYFTPNIHQVQIFDSSNSGILSFWLRIMM